MPTAAATISKLSRDHVERGQGMGDRLMNGDKLQRGQSLTSRNGAYTLTLQDDGNLVLTGGGQAVWATGTNGQDAQRLEVQYDGNCRALHSRTSRSGTPIPRAPRTFGCCCRTTATWCCTASTDRPGRPTRRLTRRRRHLRPRTAPEVVPAAAEEPASRTGARTGTSSSAATTSACSSDIHGGLRRHALGDRGTLLR